MIPREEKKQSTETDPDLILMLEPADDIKSAITTLFQVLRKLKT